MVSFWLSMKCGSVEVYSAGKRKRMVLPFKFILFLNVTILVRFSLLVKLVFHIVKFLAEYKLMSMEWAFTSFFSFVFSELLKETIFFFVIIIKYRSMVFFVSRLNVA